MGEPTKDQLIELGEVIANQAQEIFEELGFKDDFCVQSISFESAVFGGWNRLIFRPENGWYISESHCSKKFIERFYKWRKDVCRYDITHN
jgi:hypothetical protein